MSKTRVIAEIKKVECETIDSPLHPEFEALIKLIAQLIASRFTA